jgi:mono/diheme cytochrome c family protein
MKMLFFVLFVFLIVSCSENNKPSSQNNTTVNTAQNVSSSVEEGKTLFLTNCATCHAVSAALTGPALAGVEQRWKDKEKLHAFIRNSQEVIQNDQYAKDLFNKYNKVQMMHFPWIKDEQIAAILKYIEATSKEINN